MIHDDITSEVNLSPTSFYFFFKKCKVVMHENGISLKKK